MVHNGEELCVLRNLVDFEPIGQCEGFIAYDVQIATGGSERIFLEFNALRATAVGLAPGIWP